MSLALLLIGLVVLVLGLPFLAAAFGFLFWAATRCCVAFIPSRYSRTRVA